MSDKNSVFIDNSVPDVDDSWLNMTQDERNGIITSSDQAISTVDNTQSQKGVTNLVHWASFYTDGGAADAYVLSIQSPTTAPTKYKTGMEVRFRATNANTGASIINVAGLGAGKKIFKQDGTTALDANDINTSVDTRLRYDESLDAAAGAFILNNEIDASTTIKGIVELLTNAEQKTGTDSTRAATAASILSLFAASTLSITGSIIRVPINVGGTFVEFIIQTDRSDWGSATSGTETFPLTYPTAVLAVVTQDVGATGVLIGVVPSTTGFTWTAPSNVVQASYIAIGY